MTVKHQHKVNQKYVYTSDFHLLLTQQAFTCLKSTMETPEQCVKSVQN